MGLPGFLVAAVGILSSSGGGGGGGSTDTTTPKEETKAVGTPVSKDAWKETVKDVNGYGYLGRDDYDEGTMSSMSTDWGDADKYYNEYVNYMKTGKVKSFDDFTSEKVLPYSDAVNNYAMQMNGYYRYLRGLGVDDPNSYMPEYHVADEYETTALNKRVFKTEDELNKFREENPMYAETFNQWLRKIKFADDTKRFGFDQDAMNDYRANTDPTQQVNDYLSYVNGLEDKYGRTIDRDMLFQEAAGGTGGAWAIPYFTGEDADGKYFRSQADLDKFTAGVRADRAERKAIDEYSGYINDLGYGSLIGDNMNSDQLRRLWEEVQKRNEYSTLLDEMGYDYDPTDDSTSLGLLYNQAVALEDVRGKLGTAKENATKYYTDWTAANDQMTELQSDFDKLFADYGTLGTDKGALQTEYDRLMTDYSAAEDRLKAAQDNLSSIQGDYDSLSGLYNTLDSNYGTLTEDYNSAIGQLGNLQGEYDQLFGDYSRMQGDYSGLQADYGNLQADYGRTSEDLAAALQDAGKLRTDRQITQSNQFLQGQEEDKAQRMAGGLGAIGQVQPPAQTEYTQAMEGLAGTQLNPLSYQMEPIDFAGSMNQDIFKPMPIGGPGAYGTTDYTDIFAGPQMDMTQYNYDYGQNFNPYFDAINQQYGVNLGTGYQLPPLGGKR